MCKCARRHFTPSMAMDAATSIVFIATMIPFVANAGPYGPFAPDEDYVVELGTCEGDLDAQQMNPPVGTADFYRSDSQQRLRITMAGTGYYEAQVFSSGVPLSMPASVSIQATTPNDVGLDDAICHDLNRDGATDFIVTLWGHGNGLGAEFYDRLIVLSSGNAYRFWVVPTMGPSAEDFVTFGHVEPLVMVTRAFVQKRDWPEGAKSYFVYDLWAFHGDALELANSIDSRFPKWVRYTSEPNWKPAVSLSEDDKRRLRSNPRPTEATP